jgi:hypothetical protein
LIATRMNRINAFRKLLAAAVPALVAAGALVSAADNQYQVKATHPRLIVEDVAAMARRCMGPLTTDFRVVKERADAAVRRGSVEFISNRWSVPEDLMNCGLTYLVERELGHECQPYAELIAKQWADGQIISNRDGSHFGYHALAYDWIYDALTPEQRVLYGERCSRLFSSLTPGLKKTGKSSCMLHDPDAQALLAAVATSLAVALSASAAEDVFAVKWLIVSQIAGEPGTSANASVSVPLHP